jgi:hypothetical protein
MQIMMNTKRLDETFSTIFLVTEGLMIIPTIFGNLLLIMCIKRYKILQIWSNILMEHINHLLDNLKCQSGKATAA